MNQEYNHKNIPLNTPIVRELICKLYSGKGYVKRSVIIEEVLQYHLDQGGNDPEVQLAAIVSDVLGKMRNEGRAERRDGSPGFWKILPSAEQKGETDISEKSPQEIADAALPSTVLLEMKDANGQQHGGGSGFFVREGEIVTNFHVVEGAYEGSAKLFARDEWYDIEGYTVLDVNNDLIMLKIKPPDQESVDISALSLGDSDNVRRGDPIYAVGNPVGLEGTISDGIISGIRPPDRSQDIPYKSIQITAPISPGSSGGAVLNTKGEVIGVSVSGVSSLRPISSQSPQDEQYINVAQNLNFAIPSNNLKQLLQQRDKKGDVIPLPQAKLERVTSIGKLEWIGSASYTFHLQNQSSANVKDIHCTVIFKDEKGNEITKDFVVFPSLIPARLSKTVIRLSIYDTLLLEYVTPSSIQLLQETINYDETDINNNPIESFLVGLADLLLTNMGHANYSAIEPHIKRLMKNYEIQVTNLTVVD